MYLLPQSTDVCSWTWITECSTDWTQYGSHCYKAFQVEVNWDDARHECLDLNSDLASITNMAENSFINTAFLLDQKEELWIGLNDKEKEDEFHWSDGTPFNFSIFSRSDPKHGRTTNCVLMKNDGHWLEHICSYKRHYICKKRGENNFYKLYCLRTWIKTLPLFNHFKMLNFFKTFPQMQRRHVFFGADIVILRLLV